MKIQIDNAMGLFITILAGVFTGILFYMGSTIKGPVIAIICFIGCLIHTSKPDKVIRRKNVENI